jgi:hypothetical protein
LEVFFKKMRREFCHSLRRE